MLWVSRACVAFCLLAVMLASGASASELDRHALVITNSDYRPHSGLSPLPQARIDGNKIADLLRARMLNFAPVRHENVQTKAEFQKAWKKFLDELDSGDAKQAVAVFYYSGHGAEVGNESYILPTEMLPAPQQPTAGAPPTEPQKDLVAPHLLDAHIMNQGIKLKVLFEEFDKRVKALQIEKDRTIHGVFIIDACRSPPPPGGTQKSVIDKSGARPVVPPPGIFVFYAASAGQVAHARFQGETEETASVYTRHLLPLLEKRYSLQQIARLVRWEVHDAVAAKMPKLPQTPQYFDDVTTRRILSLSGLEADNPNPEAEQRLRTSTSASKLTVHNVPEPGYQVWECPTCPRLVVVPTGSFKMGSRRDEAGHNDTEETKRDKYADNNDRRLDVAFEQSFAIGVTEVTVAQYRAFLTKDSEKDCTPALHPACDTKLDPEKPIVGVSWREAQDYLGWLNTEKLKLDRAKPEIGHYRLPTESEWEYAARGGAEGPFLVHSDRELCEYGNGADQALRAVTLVNSYCNDRVGRGVTHVQSYKPNAFGLYDVHGNASEWVADCWNSALTDDKADAAKAFRHGELNDANCRRVARGGSWLSAPEALRLSKRAAYAPDQKRPTLGFRVVRVLPMKP